MINSRIPTDSKGRPPGPAETRACFGQLLKHGGSIMERSRTAAPARAGAYALVALVLAAAPATADRGYQGNVDSVNPQTGQLVVTDALTARNFELVVTPETRILSSLGQPLLLTDLKKGDGLGVAASGRQADHQREPGGVAGHRHGRRGYRRRDDHRDRERHQRSVKVPVNAQTPVRSASDKPVRCGPSSRATACSSSTPAGGSPGSETFVSRAVCQ